MARTVDPARHRARRLAIIDAGLTCFAAEGFDRTTTAALCRQAGIGSGTFFHYFPTKLSLLLAILELGTAQTRAWWADRPHDEPARTAIDAYVDHALVEYGDPRVAGFVQAVGALVGEPAVAEAIRADEQALREQLLPRLREAQAAGQVRSDAPAGQLVVWTMLLLDGLLGRIAWEPDLRLEREAAMLRDALGRLLAP